LDHHQGVGGRTSEI